MQKFQKLGYGKKNATKAKEGIKQDRRLALDLLAYTQGLNKTRGTKSKEWNKENEENKQNYAYNIALNETAEPWFQR